MADGETAGEYQEEYEDLYVAWQEADTKASLVDSLEEEVKAKDKEIATLRARAREPYDYEFKRVKEEAAEQKKIYEEKIKKEAAEQKKAYEETIKKDAQRIRDLEKQVATQSKSNGATTLIPAIPDTLEGIMEQLRQLKLENAALKGMKQRESEHEEGSGQKKRKRHDKTPM